MLVFHSGSKELTQLGGVSEQGVGGGILKKVDLCLLRKYLSEPMAGTLSWRIWRISMAGATSGWEHGNLSIGEQKIFQQHRFPYDPAKASPYESRRGFLQLWFDPRDGRKQCSRFEANETIRGQAQDSSFAAESVPDPWYTEVILRRPIPESWLAGKGLVRSVSYLPNMWENTEYERILWDL